MATIVSLQQLLRTSTDKLDGLKKIVPISQYKTRVAELDRLLELGDVWSDAKKAGALAKERQSLVDIVGKMERWQKEVADDLEYLNMFAEEAEKELGGGAEKRLGEINSFELIQKFKDPLDKNAAILSINAGAGGLESCDLSSMLLRMYCRYCDANGFKVEMLDSREVDGGYIDSATIMISGEYAYGYFRGESGTHRLVRNSPFNAGNARHTSFAAVRVLPDADDSIDIKIEEKDLDIKGTFSGGAGGQSVNRTKSACFIRHLPSNISFTVRTERSFHDNKRNALKLLAAKLYDIELRKKNAERDREHDNLTDIAFGNQIRSYVLSPYTLVKDHRTEFEIKNAGRVLDGDIHGFLEAYLRSK